MSILKPLSTTTKNVDNSNGGRKYTLQQQQQQNFSRLDVHHVYRLRRYNKTNLQFFFSSLFELNDLFCICVRRRFFGVLNF